jgi:diguanylate cyclase (GGDEF)-like protein
VTPADALLEAVREMVAARDVDAVARTAARAASRLAGADGSALAVVEGRYCHFVEESGAGPGWKGRRIPLTECLAGRAVLTGGPVVVPDVRADLALDAAPYWSGPVASLAAVPVVGSEPAGALVVHWTARRVPAGGEMRSLRAVADAAALAVENLALRSTMESRVRDRTAELERANRRLEREIGERRRAEELVRHESHVDELTGLFNRRGFLFHASRELEAAKRTGRRAIVLFFDLDGLKRANDTRGHEAGDRLLAAAGAVLRSATRDSDVAARIGGDEFAVFMTLGYDAPPVHLIAERFLEAARRAGVSWSIGATATPPGRNVSLDDLLAGADEAMYRGRRARRRPA